ncbi:hypothetical protein ACTMU2_13555 [Cupriavidus basilensis]
MGSFDEVTRLDLRPDLPVQRDVLSLSTPRDLPILRVKRHVAVVLQAFYFGEA